MEETHRVVGNPVGGSDGVGERVQAQRPVGGRPSPGPSAGRARVGLLCGLLPFSQDEQHSGQPTGQGGGVDLVLWFSRLLCEAVRHRHSAGEKTAEGTLSGRDRTGLEQGLAGPGATAVGDGAGEGPSG